MPARTGILPVLASITVGLADFASTSAVFSVDVSFGSGRSNAAISGFNFPCWVSGIRRLVRHEETPPAREPAARLDA